MIMIPYSTLRGDGTGCGGGDTDAPRRTAPAVAVAVAVGVAPSSLPPHRVYVEFLLVKRDRETPVHRLARGQTKPRKYTKIFSKHVSDSPDGGRRGGGGDNK